MENKIEKRIINGSPAPDGQVPWAGQMKAIVRRSNFYNCGVTIISTQWLLTVAHCFNLKAENYRNRMGRILHFHVEQIVIHPNYDRRNWFHDIALIKVRGRIPLDGTYVAIANLPPAGNPNNIPEVGSINYVVGFGCLYVGGDLVNRAHVIGLKTNTKQECASTYGSRYLDQFTQFCAGYFYQNRGTCSGDSGSGLISFRYGQPMIVGVASATNKNDVSNLPAKFMRVAPYVSWIKQYVG
ncbi:hypothetical protein PHET_11000 [Paragonimus heterotremus]|uniref:Peptidase S1 domain-containing protein n=1 Tax=Paragonimus heterotremus TaxID=100268 RepID=A0A8J4STX8_9TREM|nr:hypothetical protein PHET_11000 [Paragonimus heterotremus]